MTPDVKTNPAVGVFFPSLCVFCVAPLAKCFLHWFRSADQSEPEPSASVCPDNKGVLWHEAERSGKSAAREEMNVKHATRSFEAFSAHGSPQNLYFKASHNPKDTVYVFMWVWVHFWLCRSSCPAAHLMWLSFCYFYFTLFLSFFCCVHWFLCWFN